MVTAEAVYARLRVECPAASQDRTWEIQERSWRVGRSTDCHSSIDHPLLGSEQFQIDETAEGFFVTDFGGRYRTRLNGEWLNPYVPTSIKNGDELQVEAIRMTFEIPANWIAQPALSTPPRLSLVHTPIFVCMALALLVGIMLRPIPTQNHWSDTSAGLATTRLDQIETNIRATIEYCARFEGASLKETRRCLAPAIAVNPQHPAILKALESVETSREPAKASH
ncbi:MAG: FHA domain-containing protein [Bdellovibrionales bacterium]